MTADFPLSKVPAAPKDFDDKTTVPNTESAGLKNSPIDQNSFTEAFPVFKTVDLSEQMEVGNQFGMFFL